MEFALWLTARLASQRRSQTDVARELGVTQAAVSQWCGGVYAPTSDRLDALLTYLACDDGDAREAVRLLAARAA